MRKTGIDGLSKNTNKIENSDETVANQNGIKKSSFRVYFRKYQMLLYILTIFYTVAITLWLVLDEIFYLINFGIIGTSIGLGFGLWPVFKKKNK